MPSNREVLATVEDKVETEIQRCDYDQMLSDKSYDYIVRLVADEVFQTLLDEMRPELSSADNKYIESKVATLVEETLNQPAPASRFQKAERVVCRIGGEHGWAAGTIQALDEEDPQDPTGRTKLPYVVKLDAPIDRLISVPHDEGSVCRAEVCFGHFHDALGFTLRCKPARRETKNPRFGVGDRVACAIEDESGDYTVWAAGKVSDVDYDIEPDVMMQDRELGLSWDWTKKTGVIPYRVLLDSGVSVYAHRDVHWLVRDLTLQPAGPRQAADGTRALKRMAKRRHGESGWEMIDHATRKVRYQAADDDSSEDSAAD